MRKSPNISWRRATPPPAAAEDRLAPPASADDEVLTVQPALTPRDEAIFLLHVAAEVEHELMVQYLYAAYSLDVERLAGDQRALVSGWRQTLIEIAREEMGHFLTVQNVLRLLGGPLRFGRADSPHVAALHPFPFRLEPFTRAALAKYIVAESPLHHDVDISDVLATAGSAGDDTGRALHRVGRLYVRIENVLQQIEATVPSESSAAYQAVASDWGGGPAMLGVRLATLSEAIAALGQVAIQGEGLHVRADVLSHFERLLSIFRQWPDGFAPACPVPVNPTLSGDDNDHAITDATSARWANLADLRYRTLLMAGGHALALAGGEDERRPYLTRLALAEMRHLAAIATELTRMPRHSSRPATVACAAALFSPPYTTDLPDREGDRWLGYLDIVARTQELVAELSPAAPAPLRTLLEAIGATTRDLSRTAAEWAQSPQTTPVVVAGSGPAGLAAALALARAGVPIHLLESAPWPGGKVSSHRSGGHSLDHGVHGWWMNYLNFDELLAWSGVDLESALQVARGSTLIHRDGRCFPLRTIGTEVPSPLFLALQLLRSPFLSKLDLLKAARFFLHVLAFDHERDYDAYDGITFAELMRRCRVPDDLRINMLEPFILSFDFATSERVSAACGLSGLQFYVVPSQRSILARWARGLPADVIFGPILAKLESYGARVSFDTRLESVLIGDGAVRAVRVSTTGAGSADEVLATVALDEVPASGFARLPSLAGGVIWMGRDPSGQPLAFDATCPHAGCAVDWSTVVFACACHGSEFGPDGTLRRGPAVTGLSALRCRPSGSAVDVLGPPRSRTLLCRDVVVATDVEAAKRIVRSSPGAPSSLSERIEGLGTNPVIAVRLWFALTVGIERIESAITPEFPFIDNYFDLTEFDPDIAREGHVLEVQSYRVDEYLGAADATILDAALADVALIHPALRGVKPVFHTINRHVALFTRYGPNEHGKRPSHESGVAGLHLAGDWTRADWSVWMMERGVVSGLRAANGVLARRGLPPTPILRLPPEHWLLRLSRTVCRGLLDLFRLGERVTHGARR
jgi:uncharacterized protein with NAD-binding domain and iron-sulfur cluster